MWASALLGKPGDHTDLISPKVQFLNQMLPLRFPALTNQALYDQIADYGGRQHLLQLLVRDDSQQWDREARDPHGRSKRPDKDQSLGVSTEAP